MHPIFLILVLGASNSAVPETARNFNHEVPAVAVKRHTPGVFKDGGGGYSSCAEEVSEDVWQMTLDNYENIPCNLNFANGLFLKLWEGKVVTTESEGNFARGSLRVYASGLPYRLIGDERHLVEPHSITDIVIEDEITHVLSKEGRTSVIACEVSGNSACVKRGFILFEGDMISLKRDGQVSAWTNSKGKDLTLENNGGCNVGKNAGSAPWSILALFWTFLWLRRRERRIL